MSLRFGRALLVAVLLLLVAFPVHAQEAPPVWSEPDGSGGANVHLHVFHSLTCPHCQVAMPFIRDLAASTPWLKLHEYELSESQANALQYVRYAEALGQEAMYVPAFFYCGKMVTGYDTAEGMGAQIAADLEACHAQALADLGPAAAAAPAAAGASGPAAAVSEPAPVETVNVPLMGAVSVEALSMPALTVVLATLDAFNPCAFFVLMFLLSLMVHAKNRGRMLAIGAIFVLFSGLIYFVFMAAWLNVFLWIGEIKLITLIAGLVAIVLALINIKDFFWFKQGVSLSIPESAKPGLFARMRKLVGAESMPAMIGGTVVLALAANSYELLCTSGFPMIYTRALTLRDLSTAGFYGYLAAYNLIYVLPLMAIVALFAVRFGAHKLSEREGRVLKLLSGLMMLLLGILLVVAPTALNNPLTAIGLLVLAVVVTFAVVQFEKRRAPVAAAEKKTPHKQTKPHTAHR